MGALHRLYLQNGAANFKLLTPLVTSYDNLCDVFVGCRFDDDLRGCLVCKNLNNPVPSLTFFFVATLEHEGVRMVSRALSHIVLAVHVTVFPCVSTSWSGYFQSQLHLQNKIFVERVDFVERICPFW